HVRREVATADHDARADRTLVREVRPDHRAIGVPAPARVIGRGAFGDPFAVDERPHAIALLPLRLAIALVLARGLPAALLPFPLAVAPVPARADEDLAFAILVLDLLRRRRRLPRALLQYRDVVDPAT